MLTAMHQKPPTESMKTFLANEIEMIDLLDSIDHQLRLIDGRLRNDTFSGDIGLVSDGDY
jgi:hypothetical protein